MAAANRFLAKPFLPAVKPRCTVQAEESGTAFVPWIGTHLADLLCVQEERVVARTTRGTITATVSRSRKTRTGSIM